jgi:hypothetical protein
MFSLANLAFSLFPFDPQIDTPLGHRDLIAIYVVVWVAQSVYAAYAIKKYLSSAKKR